MFTTYTKEDLESFKSINNLQIDSDPKRILEKELVERYQLDKCVEWVKENNYQKTCLQFPESLLNHSTHIALYLQKILQKTFYILADTSYGSCCVDEVAAEHVAGDSIIHFGHACLSPVMKLPVLYIFQKEDLNLDTVKKKFEIFKDSDHVIVFYEDVFHHLYSELCSVFSDRNNIHITKLLLDHGNETINNDEIVMCGRVFISDSKTETLAVYIGNDSITLQNLVLGLTGFKWYHYTKDDELLEYQMNTKKFLMQRSHLVEKIREAQVIGILIGTLGIKNYLDATEKIKSIVKRKGKKCYILAVGKPNVSKLANFPEIDVFVLISCQENSLLKDFKDYYKPVVSLFEVEMALGGRPFSVEYTSDFRELLPGGLFYKNLEINACSDSNDSKSSQELIEKDPGTLVESKGAQFLSSRSWKGLEQKIGETEVCEAVKGRRGIASGYENELTMFSNENKEK